MLTAELLPRITAEWRRRSTEMGEFRPGYSRVPDERGGLKCIREYVPQAVGFYQRMGFQPYKRTDRYEEGNPYPLL